MPINDFKHYFDEEYSNRQYTQDPTARKLITGRKEENSEIFGINYSNINGRSTKSE
jgi:hypothetical protein